MELKNLEQYIHENGMIHGNSIQHTINREILKFLKGFACAPEALEGIAIAPPQNDKIVITNHCLPNARPVTPMGFDHWMTADEFALYTDICCRSSILKFVADCKKQNDPGLSLFYEKRGRRVHVHPRKILRRMANDCHLAPLLSAYARQYMEEHEIE